MTDPRIIHAKLSSYVSGTPEGSDELTDDVRGLLALLTPGILEIAIERQRQITDEGFTPEHDRGHAPQLFDAAGEYATAASTSILEGDRTAKSDVPFAWPWQAGFWKPSENPIKNARRSGALLAAGIDDLLTEQADQKDADQ